ncbi:DUF4962 domain-containing protein [Niabella aurantiaca]|uniref:DUF4962 domain-containing protein n=1 Tax=Niabella aurantiaca TaxID=379900 RepID=UPI0003663598|nr:DUF4962 domain-containing protein [Niabella aurantiaca]
MNLTVSYFSILSGRVQRWMLVFLFILGAYNSRAQQEQAPPSAPYYTVFLDKPVPDQRDVAFNAPVLRWPVHKGKTVKYDVRLADNALFKGRNVFGAEGSSWAMYNPHRRLAPGTWYWQYRVSGEKWSDTFNFTVKPSALAMVSPGASGFLKAIPQPHPRVLPGQLGRNALKALASDPEARIIIADAERDLQLAIPDERDAIVEKQAGETAEQSEKIALDAVNALGHTVRNMVTNLCQAYLLTNDKRFAVRGREIVLKVASWDPGGITHLNDFADARCMLSIALGYDTFYELLTGEERKLLINAAKARAAHFYKSWVNNIEAKVLSGHVWQHILHYFFQTCVAIYDKNDPESARWLTYAYELFLARAPVLGGLDGGWAEGAAYFRMNIETLLDIPMTIKMYTGFDFIKAHPWYANQPDWLIYNLPPSSFTDGYGDNNETLSLQLFYHYTMNNAEKDEDAEQQAAQKPNAPYVAFANELAKWLQDPKALWYVNKCVRSDSINLQMEPGLRWFRLTRTRNWPLPEAKEIHLPMARLFEGTGVVSMHTNPSSTPDNLAVFLRASPFGAYGHILADQNTFNIIYGGNRMFYRTGFKISMKDPHRTGWYQQTKSANGILVDGKGQPLSIEAGGRILRFLQGERLAYAKGDASGAYRSDQTKSDLGVQKFYRHLLLLKPDIIIVYDELEAREQVNWSWLLHSIDSMKVDRNTDSYSTVVGKIHGVGKLWASAPLQWDLSDTFSVPAKNWRHPDKPEIGQEFSQSQWHASATNKKKSSKIRFLSVMKIGENASVSQITDSGLINGRLRLAIEGWVVEADLSTDHAPGLSVSNSAAGTAFEAYGDQRSLKGNAIKGRLPNSSRLIETINGTPRLTEAGDLPPGPLLPASSSPDLFDPAYIRASMIRAADWQFKSPNGKPENTWTNATFYAGVMAAYQRTGFQPLLDSLVAVGKRNGWQPSRRYDHADDIAISQLYTDLFRIFKDSAMIRPTIDTIRKLRSVPGTEISKHGITWWWCDALFMAPPVLAKLAKVLKDRAYLEFCDRLYAQSYNRLFNSGQGLFARDATYLPDEQGNVSSEANGKRIFWGRGNGWVIAGLARLLGEMPPGYSNRKYYLNIFYKMAGSLKTLQQEDGLWRTSLLDPAAYPGGEGSGTGLICYALAWGINNHILDERTFGPVVKKAWKGLNDLLGDDGKFGWVQPIGKDPKKNFDQNTTEAYGTGAFLLAASEIIELKRKEP